MEEGDTTKAMFDRTKAQLVECFRAIPPALAQSATWLDFVDVLIEANRVALEERDWKLANNIRLTLQNLEDLADQGLVTPEDGYVELRAALATDFIDREETTLLVFRELERLTDVLVAIKTHIGDLDSRYRTYRT